MEPTSETRADRSSALLGTSLLIGIVLISACSGNSSNDAADAGVNVADGQPARPDAAASTEPEVEVVSCRFAVPEALELTEGQDYECGDLVVPENRDAPTRRIRVHYVRFFSDAVSGNATVYLEGGPGGSGGNMVARLEFLGRPYLDGLLVDGDFVVIGQRGTSLSVPFLDCDSAEECLAITDDLASYNTAYNADDVEDLRATLGYQELNVYGISYGSRLALEILRRHGEHIRSAAVGGLVPSHVVWPAGVPAAFEGALTRLAASCAAHEGCFAAYGDITPKFLAGVFDLLEDPISLENGAVLLDGVTYASLVFQLMYSRSSYPWLPMVISDLAERRTDRIESLLVSAISASGNSSVARGMYYSVVCGELFSPGDPQDFDAMNAGVSEELVEIFGGSYYHSLQLCSTWPTGSLQEPLAQPVQSPVPTLVASGEMDPITPPSYGDAAAEYLDDSLVVVYANSGHGATLQTRCGREGFLSFLAEPNTAMDVSCASEITTDYVLPVAKAVAPSRELLAVEFGTRLVPPPMQDAIRRAIKTPLRAPTLAPQGRLGR